MQVDTSSPSQKDYLFKLLAVGATAVGKTSIVRRWANSIFSTNYKATVGVDFALKTIKQANDDEIRIQIWEIGGQETGVLTNSYYKAAVGALVVFDITNEESLKKAQAWKKDIEAKVKLRNGQNIPALLLANKSDLPKTSTSPHIPDDEIQKVCTEHNFQGWHKTSAVTGEGIEAAIMDLVTQILAIPQTPKDPPAPPSGIDLRPRAVPTTTNCGC